MQTLLNPAFNKVVLGAAELFDYRDYYKSRYLNHRDNPEQPGQRSAKPRRRVTTSESEPCPKLNRVGTEENVSAWDGPKGAIGNVSWVENGRTRY